MRLNGLYKIEIDSKIKFCVYQKISLGFCKSIFKKIVENGDNNKIGL